MTLVRDIVAMLGGLKNINGNKIIGPWKQKCDSGMNSLSKSVKDEKTKMMKRAADIVKATAAAV
jgi:hypothetical protein